MNLTTARFLVVAMSIVLFEARTAGATDVLFDQTGNRLGVGGPFSDRTIFSFADVPGDLQTADDFVLSNAAIINQVTFSGGNLGFLDPSLRPWAMLLTQTFLIRFYADDGTGARPETTPLAEFKTAEIVGSFTGQTVFDTDSVYEFTADIEGFLAPSDTRLWLSVIAENTTGENPPFFWIEDSDSETSGDAVQRLNPGGDGTVFDRVHGTDLSFKLSGVIVPEPSATTMTVVIFAWLGCASRRI